MYIVYNKSVAFTFFLKRIDERDVHGEVVFGEDEGVCISELKDCDVPGSESSTTFSAAICVALFTSLVSFSLLF